MTSDSPPSLHYHRAAKKSFQETIVFTHHFGGHHPSTKRHQDFVNELGFDCVSFDLNCKAPSSIFSTFRSDWVAEVRDVLNQLPGEKIMYTFSSPSMATLGAIADGPRRDVRVWICDGGPFFQAYQCLKNYYIYQTKIPSALRDLVTSIAYLRIGAVGYETTVKRWFREFPPGVPILSIRAGQDKLVPVSAIDGFFAAGEHLQLHKLELSQAQHLEGLKTFPDAYKTGVKQFLLRYARAINE
jgi:pimeloyl-ACP methyl ester carboxylesterase